MLITKAIETPEGGVTFQGELKEDELEFLIEVGLNVVLAQGAASFMSEKNPKSGLVVSPSEETH